MTMGTSYLIDLVNVASYKGKRKGLQFDLWYVCENLSVATEIYGLHLTAWRCLLFECA